MSGSGAGNLSGSGAGNSDAGNSDAGNSDAGNSDAGNSDQDVWQVIDQHNELVMSDSESDDDVTPLVEDLASWANQYQIKQNAVDSLLKLLKSQGHPDLPSTARTLLKTDRVVVTQVKSGMDYYYFGVKDQLRKYLSMYPLGVVQNIHQLDISLNIDGLPLFNSNNKTVWPILCALHLEPMQLFPITLTFGNHKPLNLEFLQDAITDLNEILQNGLEFNERIIPVHIKCIVCDAPARAMVKCCKQYSGYYGCDRCDQKGEWLSKVTYVDIDNLQSRTDTSFRAQTQLEHHKGISPLCDLPIDMIKVFPLDYMHQSCLGVMKRLLLIWVKGKKGERLSANQIVHISNRLANLRPSIPVIYFARKPRDLSEVDRWKATEFRQFLLYTGKVVMKGILKKEFYDHFMTLSVALSILICPRIAADHHAYAQDLLVHFVTQGQILYGQGFMVYNVHCLLHIQSDMIEYGSLDRCSAFPFENYLHKLKKLARSGKNPLVQMVKRLGELEKSQTVKTVAPKKIFFKRPSNSYILSNTRCCEVLSEINEVDADNEKMLLCRTYERAEPYFNQPCDSWIVGAYVVQVRYSRMRTLSRQELLRPAIMIEKETRLVFLAILHEY